MKVNSPVTNNEIEMQEGTILVSQTDLKGQITQFNEDFRRLSGFSHDELLGKPHNIVRHPDMPSAAFEDLWTTVKAGKPWSGMVKNRAKNGDFYWVKANVIPTVERGAVTGYMSVRIKPTRQEITEAEQLYRQINNGSEKLPGKHKSSWLSPWKKLSLSSKLYGMGLTTILVNATVAGMLFFELPHAIVDVTLAVTAVFFTITGILFANDMRKALRYAGDKLSALNEGDYFNYVEHQRNDELGCLLDQIKITQVKLGFDVKDAQDATRAASRMQDALNSVGTNVLVADADHNIIFANKSVLEMFREAQNEIRQDLPQFNVETLVGSNIDVFHKNPHHQRGMLDNLTGKHDAELKLGGLDIGFSAYPVYDDSHTRLGTVVEWSNNTAQRRLEAEVANVVSEAQSGNLRARISTSDKKGFFRTLSDNINSLIETNELIVEDAVRVMSALAHGDLRKSIDAPYTGAYGELKSNINETIHKLTGVIDEIQDTSELVQQSSAEIAQGNINLSERTEQQSSSLEQSAASMEEITSTVQNTAKNAHSANQLASATSEKAAYGGKILTSAIEAMKEINESSKKIEDIISVIDEIAFQTNLLALNASVEAAHAGDQGQGFAVVATEVRSLAQRSAEAAKEIKILIADSVQKVEGGTELVSNSGKAIGEIIESVHDVSGLISEISTASDEQSIGVAQVNTAITQIDDATQQNAALVEETAAASEHLGEQAGALTNLTSFFTTNKKKAPATSQAAPTSQYSGSERRSAARPWSTTPTAAPASSKPAAPVAALQNAVGDNSGFGDANDWEEF
ncbi:MAG: methyl-accepting chemotaxis protein [bacterium]